MSKMTITVAGVPAFETEVVDAAACMAEYSVPENPLDPENYRVYLESVARRVAFEITIATVAADIAKFEALS